MKVRKKGAEVSLGLEASSAAGQAKGKFKGAFESDSA